MQSEQFDSYLELVDRLFVVLKAQFSGKLKDVDLDSELMRAQVWATAFISMNLTQDEFEVALINLLDETWPPTSPADFVALARANDGYADSYTAYVQAANGNYLDAVCYETAKRVGTYELRSQNENVCYKKFKLVYEAVKSEARAGSRFDVMQVPLIANQEQPAASKRYISDEQINQLKLLLG